MIAMQEAAYTQARAESSPAPALVCVSPRVVQSRAGVGARRDRRSAYIRRPHPSPQVLAVSRFERVT
jgi:hypothetical protein